MRSTLVETLFEVSDHGVRRFLQLELESNQTELEAEYMTHKRELVLRPEHPPYVSHKT